MAKKYQKVYQYVAVFEPDRESGGFTVTIPALPGCVTEGDTFEEALTNVKEAAELCLEVMKRGKEEIPIESEPVLVAPVKVRA